MPRSSVHFTAVLFALLALPRVRHADQPTRLEHDLLRDQFGVDLYQGGAGTSANMNANEVLANVGLELAGRAKGDYAALDPHDHLNMSQSTNDAYPTALKVAFLRGNDRLIPEVRRLAA